MSAQYTICPHCKEQVKADTVLCPYCKSDMKPRTKTNENVASEKKKMWEYLRARKCRRIT